MAYFDVRPSSHAPTLELRVCDACPLVDDVVLIAGIFRGDGAGGGARRRGRAALHRPRGSAASRRDLAGRAQRAVPPAGRRRAPARPRGPPPTWSGDLVGRLRPQLEELGDWETVTELAETVLARGNSADRQRAAFAERGKLEDVVRLVVAETHGQAVGRRCRRFRPSAATACGQATRHWATGPSLARPIGTSSAALVAQGSAELAERAKARDTWVAAKDLTFVVHGEHRPLQVDLVPRILGPHEWAELEAGLTQRAWAIESFLRDVYGEQRILSDGVLPPRRRPRSPGWRDEATRLPAGVVRAPVMGFDLVRNEYGGWRVLEDNVRLAQRRRLRHRRPRS